MPTDEGVRDLYIKELRDHAEGLRARLGPLREQKQLTRLEDAAQAALTPAQNLLLAQAGVVDHHALADIQAEIDQVQAELDAIQALINAARGIL